MAVYDSYINLIEQNNIKIYYHRSTSNSSFIEMSNYLAAVGIKNNRFMLALLDPELRNIDPHDPNLALYYKKKILMEIRNNFWYFLREVVRIPNAGEPSKFILNRGNMAFLYLASMNINTIFLMPRQTGKTIAAACFYVYIYNFRAQNTQISLLNKEAKDSRENLARIRAIRDLLPSYIKFDSLFSEVDGKKIKVSSNVTYMENAINHNKFRTFGKAVNDLAAANMLRGQTFPLLWADEFAFIPYMKTIYGNMIPAMSKATEIARKHNVPYGILYTTTPGFLTSDTGKYAYLNIQNATEWNESWYDLSYFEILNILSSNKLSKFVYVEYQYYQLGLSEEWFRDRCIDENWDWSLIRREYLLEWSDEAENNPFTKEDLDIIEKLCKQPIKTLMVFGKYELKIFEEIALKSNLVPSNPPIIGVDPASGTYNDYSCLTFIDSKTTRVFAELRSNSISIIELARVIEYIVLNLMPNAVVNIERTGGYGKSIIAKLKETKVKRNLYYEIKDKLFEEQVANGKIIRANKKTRIYGLETTHRIREVLIDLLKERVSLHKDKFVSHTIHKELTGLEVKKNGKIEHSDLSHDDQIFSYLMAIYVWYEGKNLKEYWNIEKSLIKTENDVDDIVTLETGPDNAQQSIIKPLEDITKVENENPKIAKLEADIAEMKKATGMLYSEFVTKMQAKEKENLQNLLRDEKARDAYARFYGIKPENIEVTTNHDSFDNQYLLPTSVFTDFNKSDEEMDNYSIYNSPSMKEHNISFDDIIDEA